VTRNEQYQILVPFSSIEYKLSQRTKHFFFGSKHTKHFQLLLSNMMNWRLNYCVYFGSLQSIKGHTKVDIRRWKSWKRRDKLTSSQASRDIFVLIPSAWRGWEQGNNY